MHPFPCGGAPFGHLLRSDRRSIAVELVILVVAALASAEVGEVVHELDGRDPLHHLEAELVFAPQPQGRAMQDASLAELDAVWDEVKQQPSEV